MKGRSKKITSLLLTLVFVLGLLVCMPVTALAEEPTTNEMATPEELGDTLDALQSGDTLDASQSEDTINPSEDMPLMVFAGGPTTYEVETPEELSDALDALQSGDTISLTANINYPFGIELINDSESVYDRFILDLKLNGFTLDVNNNGEIGMDCGLYLQGVVINTDFGGGEFNVTGPVCGLSAEYSSVSVTNVTCTGSKETDGSYFGVRSSESEVTVRGDVNARGYKNYTVYGVFASGYNGDLGHLVTVRGDINARGSGESGAYGINAVYGAWVDVYGDVKASAMDATGVYASSDGSELCSYVDVFGSISAAGTYNALGAAAYYYSTIWVKRSDTSDDGRGYITASSDPNGDAVGAQAAIGGTVIVDRGITAKTYIILSGEEERTQPDFDNEVITPECRGNRENWGNFLPTSYYEYVNDADTIKNLVYVGELTDTTPEKYNVYFNSQGGSDVASILGVVSGSKISRPVNPTMEGSAFVDWYTDDGFEGVWNFEIDTVTHDITLYAKWTQDPTQPVQGNDSRRDPVHIQVLTPTIEVIPELPSPPLAFEPDQDIPEQEIPLGDIPKTGVETPLLMLILMGVCFAVLGLVQSRKFCKKQHRQSLTK